MFGSWTKKPGSGDKRLHPDVPDDVSAKLDGALNLSSKEYASLPDAVKQALKAKETVKIYTTPDYATTRSARFKFEGEEGLELSKPGQQIAVIVPGGAKMNLQDVWLGHRNKPETAGLPSGYLSFNSNGAYTKVLVFDGNTNSWRMWQDPKGHDPVKYAEPRDSIEFEKLGDYFGMLGEVKPVAFLLVSAGKGDPMKSRVTEHSLEVVSYPEMHKGIQVMEQQYSPGNGFVDFATPGGYNRLPRYGGGKSHHKKGPHQTSGGEGGYPGAIALRGETGYETWQGGLSESAKGPNEYLDEHGRLWIKIPEGKKLRSLEISAGARWWSSDHLNPILGVHGGRKISAYIVSADGKKKDHFMRSLNVGPQGVLMGGPSTDEYVSEEGDWIMIEGERAPSYLMGWRLMMEDAEGAKSSQIADVQESTNTMVHLSKKPELNLQPTHQSPGGTQGAKWYLDQNSGDRFIVKDYVKAGPEAKNRCATEFIANSIYRMMGIPAQESYIHDGKFVAREIKGLEKFSYAKGKPQDFYSHKDIRDGFLVDAWLANWDVFGKEYDNVFRTPDNRMVRLDAGGTMFFRAMGGYKSSFGKAEVTEIETMRNKNHAKEAGVVFGNQVGNNNIQQQAEKLIKVMTDGNIKTIVSESGISNAAEVIKALIARRDWIAQKYLGGGLGHNSAVIKPETAHSIPPYKKVPPTPLNEKFQDLPLTGQKKTKPDTTKPAVTKPGKKEISDAYVPVLQSTGKTVGESGYECVDSGEKKTGHYLVKEYGGSVDRCATEYIADKIYEAMGIPTVDARMIDGKFVSKMTPGLSGYKGHNHAEKIAFFNHPDVINGFVVDAWLANWNVFGLQNHYVRKQGDRMVRTSNQGSLFFRANGSNKPHFANTHVSEIGTMRNKLNGAGEIFSELVSESMIETQVSQLQQVMTDELIQEIVESSGISNLAQVVQILIARRNWLIEQFV